MRLGLKAALLAGIPLAIMTAIGIALIMQGQEANGRSTLAVGVIIAAVAGASTLYEIERWSLRTRSFVHLGVMAVTVLPALLLSGWFPLDGPLGYLLVVGLFLLVGAVLWSVMALVFRVRPSRGRAAD